MRPRVSDRTLTVALALAVLVAAAVLVRIVAATGF